MKSKEILDHSKLAFNIAFVATVAYYTFDLFNLPLNDVQDIKEALPYLISTELAALYFKDKAVKKLRNAKRKIGEKRVSRRVYRSKERTKQKALQIAFMLTFLFITLTAIEKNTQYKPINAIQNTVGDLLDGVVSQTQAFEGSEVFSGNETMSEQEIIDEIHRVFGSQGDNAVRVARCESNLNPTAVGDKTLLVSDPATGETMGTSIGVFQIRTGGETIYGTFNRARDLGISVEEFIRLLMNPRYNIAYAKKLFDQSGQRWSPTWSCATSLGIR